jgi:hypothetical protein
MASPDLRTALQAFVAWLQAYGDTSQDPYDFWANPAGQKAKRLAYRHKVAGTAAAAPFVLLDAALPGARRFFRAKQRFPIADAHYAMGFFNLAATAAAGGAASGGAAPDREDEVAAGARYLDALTASRAPGFTNAGWGYPFDWEGWFGTFKAGTPFITTTVYGYEAFEQGYEITGDPTYLDMMHSVARFAFEDLTEQEVAPGARASSYGPHDQRRVVNASAYRAFLLARAGLRFERDDWSEAARGNLAFVLRSQQNDGSWLYAMDDRDHFVDNFHTCLVLKNLAKFAQDTGHAAAQDAIRQGYAFYKRKLLDEAGLPVPFAQAQRLNLVRRELYDLAEGINLALLMRGADPEADSIAERLVQHVLEDWMLPDGHFVTRITWFGRNTIPYHRWAQAQTFHALTRTLLDERPAGSPTGSRNEPRVAQREGV